MMSITLNYLVLLFVRTEQGFVPAQPPSPIKGVTMEPLGMISKFPELLYLETSSKRTFTFTPVAVRAFCSQTVSCLKILRSDATVVRTQTFCCETNTLPSVL